MKNFLSKISYFIVSVICWMPIISFIILVSAFSGVRTRRHLEKNNSGWKDSSPLLEYVLADLGYRDGLYLFDEDIQDNEGIERYQKYIDIHNENGRRTRYVGVILSNWIYLFSMLFFGAYESAFFIPEHWGSYDAEGTFTSVRFIYAFFISIGVCGFIGSLFSKCIDSLEDRNKQIDRLLEEPEKEKVSQPIELDPVSSDDGGNDEIDEWDDFYSQQDPDTFIGVKILNLEGYKEVFDPISIFCDLSLEFNLYDEDDPLYEEMEKLIKQFNISYKNCFITQVNCLISELQAIKQDCHSVLLDAAEVYDNGYSILSHLLDNEYYLEQFNFAHKKFKESIEKEKERKLLAAEIVKKLEISQPTKKTRGRYKTRFIKEDIALKNRWENAKDAQISKGEFCSDEGITINALDRALRNVRRN